MNRALVVVIFALSGVNVFSDSIERDLGNDESEKWYKFPTVCAPPSTTLRDGDFRGALISALRDCRSSVGLAVKFFDAIVPVVTRTISDFEKRCALREVQALLKPSASSFAARDEACDDVIKLKFSWETYQLKLSL